MNIRIKEISKKTQVSFSILKDKLKKIKFICSTKDYLKRNISRIKIRDNKKRIKKDNNKRLAGKYYVSNIFKIFKKEIKLFDINKSFLNINNYNIFNNAFFNKLSKAKSKLNLLNKNNKLNVISKLNNKSNSDYNIDFVGIHYSEHKLSIIHLCKSTKTTIVKKHIKIEIDTKLIGDSKVENIEEVKNIIEDVIEVFGLKNPPITLLLSS